MDVCELQRALPHDNIPSIPGAGSFPPAAISFTEAAEGHSRIPTKRGASPSASCSACRKGPTVLGATDLRNLHSAGSCSQNEELIGENVTELSTADKSNARDLAWRLLLFSIRNGGAAFIKWGQWSATREDMFPTELCRVLANLHDQAPTHSWAESKRSIEGAFGEVVEKLFETIEERPIASGSIAQVLPARTVLSFTSSFVLHPPRLKSRSCSSARHVSRFEHTTVNAGVAQFQVVRPVSVANVTLLLQVHRAVMVVSGKRRSVAVKVRHPGVEVRIKQDFQLLKPLAAIASKVHSTANLLNVTSAKRIDYLVVLSKNPPRQTPPT